MTKTLKKIISCIVIFFILFNYSCVMATSDEELNYSEEEYSENTSRSVQDTETNLPVTNETTSSSLSTLAPSTVTSVSNINSYEQANLDLNNILSIILIAIGVLLILFAIAILIRLKSVG